MRRIAYLFLVAVCTLGAAQASAAAEVSPSLWRQPESRVFAKQSHPCNRHRGRETRTGAAGRRREPARRSERSPQRPKVAPRS